jgi:hypothetical protein
MRIEYELTFSDYLLFNVIHQFFSIPVQLLYCGAALLLFYSPIEGQPLYVTTIVVIIAYFAIWTIQLLFNVFYLGFGKNRSLLTKHIVEIQDEAFYDETKFGRAYHFWPGIVKVISRPGFIAVYVHAHAAHVLPNRAFSSPAHRQAFLLALKEKINVA